MKKPETLEELTELILSILPDAMIDCDADGEFIIYTGVRDNADETGLIPSR